MQIIGGVQPQPQPQQLDKSSKITVKMQLLGMLSDRLNGSNANSIVRNIEVLYQYVVNDKINEGGKNE